MEIKNGQPTNTITAFEILTIAEKGLRAFNKALFTEKGRHFAWSLQEFNTILAYMVVMHINETSGGSFTKIGSGYKQQIKDFQSYLPFAADGYADMVIRMGEHQKDKDQ